MLANPEVLFQKIQALPPERLAEVDDFVEFLYLKEQHRSLVLKAAQTSTPSFAAVWDNTDDEAYDAL